jgi:hypothetical protein
MSNSPNFPSHDPHFTPNHRGVESEEDEMLHNDIVERPLPGRGMDSLAESGDRDPLIENATEQNDEAAPGVGMSNRPEGNTGDPQVPQEGGRKREDVGAAENASRSHDAEEDRVRPGDRKHGRE